MTPTWTRPDVVRPPHRGWMPLLGGAVALGLAATVGMLVAGEPARSTTIIPIPVVAPVRVTVPAAPAPIVHVNVPPPPAPPVVVEPTPTFRAVTPTIDPGCVGLWPGGDVPAACAWDRGFPAISADGSMIANAYVPDDGNRGYPGLTIVFTNTVTSKHVRSIRILDPSEYNSQDPDNAQMRARILRRATTVQRTLDAHRFRTLVPLGETSLGSSFLPDEDRRKQIYAELEGNAMRLLDPATKTVLWQHRFEHPAPPRKHPHGTSDCDGWSFAAMNVAWDPTSRIVVGNLTYHHGGCMCDSSSVTQVFRI